MDAICFAFKLGLPTIEKNLMRGRIRGLSNKPGVWTLVTLAVACLLWGGRNLIQTEAEFLKTVTPIIASLIAIIALILQLRLNSKIARAKVIYDINEKFTQFSPTINACELFRDIRAYGAEIDHAELSRKPVRSEQKIDEEHILFDQVLNRANRIKGMRKGFPVDSKKTPAIAFAERGVLKEIKNVRDSLRFLKTIMLTLESGIIRDDDIFPLIGYRVITILNNPVVQREFLFVREGASVRAEFSFVTVFALYERLMRYIERRFRRRLGNATSVVSSEMFLRDFEFMRDYDLRVSSERFDEMIEFLPRVAINPEVRRTLEYLNALKIHEAYRPR